VKPSCSFKTLPFAARGIIVLFAAAGIASIALALWYQSFFSATRLGFLPLLAAVSAQYKARVYRETTISILTPVVMIGVIADEPAVSMLAAICGITIQMLLPSKKLILHRLIFNAGMIALTVAATWWTHRVVTTANHSADATSCEIVATILASFVYFLSNSIFIALIISTTQQISILSIWVQHLMYSAPSFLMAGLLATGLAGLMTAPVVAVPIALILSASIAYYGAIRRATQPVVSSPS
jgi:hypothetical protein